MTKFNSRKFSTVTQFSLLLVSEHVLQKFRSNDDVFNVNYMSITSAGKEPQAL